MTETDYKRWVNDMLLSFIEDNEVHSGINREDLARKYAMAKGIDIPEIDEVPKAWRAELNEPFYMVSHHLKARWVKDTRWKDDDKFYVCGNYFKTKERAEEVAERMRLYYRLEQLHDIFCPDYKPDWDKNTIKYIINKECDEGCFEYGTRVWHDQLTVAFPSEEIAKNVCDILNKEFV